MDISVRHLLTEKISNFYEIDSQLGAVLCAAGLASQIAKKTAAAPALTETKWFVQRLQNSGTLAITCQRPGGETVSFQSAPEAYKKAGLRYCDSNCPPEVLADYARRYGQPEVAGNIEAVMNAELSKQRR